jgi:serine/threonine-protein kinase HipA
MTKSKEKWIEFIQLSFLSTDFKEKYIQLINERFERITEKAIDEIITEK